MIVETGRKPSAMIVDGVKEVLTVDNTHIDQVPGSRYPADVSIAKIGDRLVVLLDPITIFRDTDLAAA